MEHKVKKVKSSNGEYSAIYEYDNEYIDQLFDINTKDTPETLEKVIMSKSIEYISKDKQVDKVTQSNPSNKYKNLLDSL
jgi:uncharacterized protein YgiM (DUF1202 family)